MRIHRSTQTAALSGIAMLSLALSGCGLGESIEGDAVVASEGSVAASVDLAGVEITVGSKEFTEQRILGQLLIDVLSAAGADVKDETGLVGTTARTALDSGKIDTYYEYTGTGWINILKETEPVVGSDEQFAAVREKDAANGVTWLEPAASANNTYAIAANPAMVEKYDVATISEYAQIANENPEDATLCSAPEFPQRKDGLPSLEEAYGFDLSGEQLATLDFGLVYVSVGKGDPCNFAVVFATDGQVVANDLTILEDDKANFPAYNIALTMNTEVYEANQEAYDTLFGAINPLLTDEQMLEMNAAVDVEGQDVDAVVADFLEENDIL